MVFRKHRGALLAKTPSDLFPVLGVLWKSRAKHISFIIFSHESFFQRLQFDCLMFSNFSALKQICQWLDKNVVHSVTGEVCISPFYMFHVVVHLVLFLWTSELCEDFIGSFSCLPFFISLSHSGQVSNDIVTVCMEVWGWMLYLQGDFYIMFQTIDVLQN